MSACSWTLLPGWLLFPTKLLEGRDSHIPFLVPPEHSAGSTKGTPDIFGSLWAPAGGNVPYFSLKYIPTQPGS